MTACFNLYGFKTRTEAPESDVRRRRIPIWDVGEATGWMLDRCDVVLVERDPAPYHGVRGVTHHLCSDPSCPGGCE